MRPLGPSLGVVMLVLASVGTASADCAWVLWALTGESGGPTTGYATKAECDAGLSRIEMTNQKLPSVDRDSPNVGRSLDGGQLHVFTKDANGRRFVTFYSCLPDTVDPRGPKGGAR